MRIGIWIAPGLLRLINTAGREAVADAVQVSAGSTVADITPMLGIEDIPTIFMVNGRQANKTTVLDEGDILKIFSSASGG